MAPSARSGAELVSWFGASIVALPVLLPAQAMQHHSLLCPSCRPVTLVLSCAPHVQPCSAPRRVLTGMWMPPCLQPASQAPEWQALVQVGIKHIVFSGLEM